MGAGAGYTIEVKNCRFLNFSSFTVTDIDDMLLSIDCQADAIGDIKGESYYYGCPFVKDVPMVVTHIDLNYGELFDGYHVDPRMLTAEAANRIVNELRVDYDIEDIQDVYFDDEFISLLTPGDFNTDTLVNCLLASYFGFSGEASLGGGWSHSTFTGNFTISCERPYADESYTIQIPDTFVVDYLDKAIVGDNVSYDIVFNNEVLDTYGYGEERGAIAYLKQRIDEAIAEDGPEAVIFSQCYVEQFYDILLNGGGEFDIDNDGTDIVYNADADPDYADYI